MQLVIMCGGSGTRLWPISRTSTPKQFVKLFDHKSLFELTLERNAELVNGVIVVVNEKQLPLCQEQIPENLKKRTQFIIEPIGRNTAPVIALAAQLAPNEDLLVVASDHLIKDLDQYQSCVKQAQDLAQSSLVTFGLQPTYPETGFGYIEFEKNKVLSFKEKPDLETAKKYIASGRFLWNSGMFFFKAPILNEELKKYSLNILEKAQAALKNAIKKENIFYIQEKDMLAIPKDSIDYAVMEKSANVSVVPSHFYWTDLGSFDALYNLLSKDENGNTIQENVYHLESKNNLVLGHKKVIATFDIEDLIVVDTKDALLIGKRGESQKVKTLLEEIQKNHSDLLD